MSPYPFWAKLFHQRQLLRISGYTLYLTYDVHVTKTVSSCMEQLVQIGRIKHLLDKKTLLLLISSFSFFINKTFLLFLSMGEHI